MAIYIGGDKVVTLNNLTDSLTGSYQNSATVSGTLYTSNRTSVTTFDVDYVSASSGDYRGTIPASVTSTLTNGDLYIISVLAVSGSSQQVFEEEHIATYLAA